MFHLIFDHRHVHVVRCGFFSLCAGKLRVCLHSVHTGAEDSSVLDATCDILRSQGRMKFVRPLFKALKRSVMGKELSVKLFTEVRAGYHPIAEKMVAADLGV